MIASRNKKMASALKVAPRYRVILILLGTIFGGYLGALAAPSATETLFTWISGLVRTDHAAPSVGTLLPSGSKVKAPGSSESKQVLPSASKSDAGDTSPADSGQYPDSRKPGSVLPFLLLGAMAGAFISFRLVNLAEFLMDRWDKMDHTERLVRVAGVIVGILVSFPFILFVSALGLPGTLLPWLYVVLMAGSITICMYLAAQASEVLPGARARGPMRRTGIKLLDTNVIIDGRIYEVAKNGFLEGKLYLPRFVLEELQHIADHHDPLKRQRGKRGLEVLNLLQADFEIEAGTKDHFAGDSSEPVDSRLVKLARAIGADLVTNDHNLNRVASLQDVRVLNINDLALALRPNVLPSESLKLAIIKEGNQFGQGVGYLDDGTMVVVENGRAHIGETVDICVTQVIQTERGKMIFGEVGDEVEEIYPRRRGAGNGNGPRRA